MSDDPEDADDWLASQFNPTEQVPKQDAAAAAPAIPPAPATAPSTASAPEPTAQGGFNWGLRPSSAVVPPPVEPAVPQAAATPPALVVPPEPVSLPAAAPIVPPVAAWPAQPEAVEPPPTEPYLREPTQPLSWNEFAATQQQSAPPAIEPHEQPTEAYTVLPWQPAAGASPTAAPESAVAPVDGVQLPNDPTGPTSAIDSLFGDHKFQEYEEVGVLATLQAPSPAEPTEAAPAQRQSRAPLATSQKVLMGVAGGLIGVLILIAMFFLGEHLGSAEAAVPKPSRTGSVATPTPAGTGGPAAPGVQQWTALQGGECIQPFSSAWAQTFTVVACSADHDAEMVFKGKLPDPSNAAYPTAASFQKQLIALCSAPAAINYAAAAAVTDLQVSFSYPPNTSAWLHGDRTYYCFVDRVSGGNLPGDLAVPKTAAGG